jgi:hypothetical protein
VRWGWRCWIGRRTTRGRDTQPNACANANANANANAHAHAHANANANANAGPYTPRTHTAGTHTAVTDPTASARR